MAKKPLIFFKIMVYFSIENWYTFRLTNTPLTEEQKEENREISKYRYVVEQTFGLLKLHFGFDRMRYIGNRKCSLEYRIKSMAFNLKKACYFF